MAAMSDTTKQILEYASITHLKCRIGRLTRCETDKKKQFLWNKGDLWASLLVKNLSSIAPVTQSLFLSKKYTALSIDLPAQ